MEPLKPETLKAVRENQLKLTQANFGQMLGYTGRQIGNIERGSSPMPLWMPLALAWLVREGAHNPFIDA